jgi:hypothetical protein
MMLESVADIRDHEARKDPEPTLARLRGHWR